MGEWTKGYLAQVQPPHQGKNNNFFSKKGIPIETQGGVQWPHPENQVTDVANKQK